MAACRDEVDKMAKSFIGYEVQYVPRDDKYGGGDPVENGIRAETSSAWCFPGAPAGTFRQGSRPREPKTSQISGTISHGGNSAMDSAVPGVSQEQNSA